MERNEKESSVEKSTKDLGKLFNPEGELEIPIGNGQKAKVYWVRAGFGNRIYYIAQAKSDLIEMERLGLIELTTVEDETPKGRVDFKNQSFVLAHSSVKENTLKVSVRGKLAEKIKDYIFDTGLLFFIEPPTHPPIVSYSYYDEDIYREITITLPMLCLSTYQLEK